MWDQYRLMSFALWWQHVLKPFDSISDSEACSTLTLITDPECSAFLSNFITFTSRLDTNQDMGLIFSKTCDSFWSRCCHSFWSRHVIHIDQDTVTHSEKDGSLEMFLVCVFLLFWFEDHSEMYEEVLYIQGYDISWRMEFLWLMLLQASNPVFVLLLV